MVGMSGLRGGGEESREVGHEADEAMREVLQEALLGWDV